MRPKYILLPCAFLLTLFSGCATAPSPGPAPVVAAPVIPATIRGSEETSTLLDNFTAFISAVDGKPVAAGRAGWNSPIELQPGLHYLTAEFKRGAFGATAQLELTAAAAVNYQLKYTTDAQLFGKNSYCDFWIVDNGTNRSVTSVKRAAIAKGG